MGVLIHTLINTTFPDLVFKLLYYSTPCQAHSTAQLSEAKILVNGVINKEGCPSLVVIKICPLTGAVNDKINFLQFSVSMLVSMVKLVLPHWILTQWGVETFDQYK